MGQEEHGTPGRRQTLVTFAGYYDDRLISLYRVVLRNFLISAL